MRGFDREKLMAVLNDGIDDMDLPLWAAQREQLMDYLALMAKWNSVYNLTSLRDPMQMVTHHLLDSLAAVSAFKDAKNVLDVGAGGGLPGTSAWAPRTTCAPRGLCTGSSGTISATTR